MTVSDWMRRSPLLAFFTLSFAITWTLWALALASRSGLSLSNEENLLHLLDLFSLRLSSGEAFAYAIFTLGTAGPLAASLLVTWATGGRGGIIELWGRITKWRVGPRWYFVVFLVPVGLGLISLVTAVLAGGLRPGSYTPLLPAAYLVPFFLYMFIFTGLAEEPGWRGVALPRLQSRYSAVRASWILGGLWGVWHFPFIVYYNLSAGAPVFALIPILVFSVLGIVGWTIVNTWVYNSTESVFIVMLLHGWYNTVNSYAILSSQNALAQTVSAVLPWVLAIVLLRVYGGENLAARVRPQAAPVRRPAGAPVR